MVITPINFASGSICASAHGSGSASFLPFKTIKPVLAALTSLWEKARAEIPRRAEIIRVGVNLSDLSSANERQLDLFLNDDSERRKQRIIDQNR